MFKFKKLEKNKTKKGQYFSFDAITAVIIFMITMSLIVTYWFTIQGVMTTNESDAYRTAIRISDTLVSTPSTSDGPDGDNWIHHFNTGDLDNIYIAGFATQNNSQILDEWIISDLSESVGNVDEGTLETGKYNNLTTVLRTGYDVNIKVYKDGAFDGGDITYDPTYDIGLNNYTNANKTVTTYNRIIVLNTTSGDLIRGNLQVNLWID